MTSFWQAIETRDRAQDGTFVYAVKTTGVFCGPSCPSRLPLQANVEYFTAAADAKTAGYRACKRCRPADSRHPEATLMEAACRYIASHAEGFQLAGLAESMGYSHFHLQRQFKAALGITPRAFAESHRVSALKRNLRNNQPVTDAIYEAGFSSPSRVYETADQHFGMTPATYRKRGQGKQISFTIAPSATLGFLLVAQTERGVRSLAFGDTESALITALHAGFPEADSARAGSRHVAAVLAHLAGTERHLRLPLDIEATVFAALAIPCHRVARQGGALSGCRWGIERKSALLRKEGE
jgi:AraC family transcriptional regulator of adaptative response/methylated-DNA-[protein]-cysteine methyltransferase